jgi:hypothetical protein
MLKNVENVENVEDVKNIVYVCVSHWVGGAVGKREGVRLGKVSGSFP